MITRNSIFSSGFVDGQHQAYSLQREGYPNSTVGARQSNRAHFTYNLQYQRRPQWFSLRHVQFPLRVSYAVTIDKAQGQTLPALESISASKFR